LTNATLSF